MLIFSSFCVPFFLISSGYFFSSFEKSIRIRYIKRIAVIYCFTSLLYIPFYINKGIITFLRSAIFGYYHLWYLSALVLSLIFYLILEETPFSKVFNKAYPYLAVLLIIIGAFYDEYHYVFNSVSESPLVIFIGKAIKVVGGHRHAVFLAFPMVLIGKFLYEHQGNIKISKTICIVLIVASLVVSLAECLMLQHFGGNDITCDITLFNYLPAVFLFILTLLYCPKGLETLDTRGLRKIADVVYVLHILIIWLIHKIWGLKYIQNLIFVLIASVAVSYLCIRIEKIIRKKRQKKTIYQ